MNKKENQPGARETFGSRLGFILVSAGCAVGIGNVWKFPYLCGLYGGAAFILIYLLFLLLLGIPVLICEFAIGRSSRQSIARSFEKLAPSGTIWHFMKWISIIGSVILMMYYTAVGGWMLYYCYLNISGKFVDATPSEISASFSTMMAHAPTMLFWTVLICMIGFGICYFGIQNGIERISKFMMISLLTLMIILAIHSVFLDGAGAGIRFYLVPDFNRMMQQGIGNVIYAAMSQAFFTLSIGNGAMMIFASYLGKDRSLTGESLHITALDTFVALMAGFIIIPACFAYGVEPDSGPGLIFITIPNLFAQMRGGRIWGALFFVFLSFAALTTVIAVFENIIAFWMDLLHWSRRKSVLLNAFLITILSIPCVLGFNILSGVQPLGVGSTIMDLEDFIVSNNFLPLGSLGFVFFCTGKNGWGWKQFIAEADSGKGIRFPAGLRGYMTCILPLIIIGIYLKGYYDKFAPMGPVLLISWMAFAFALLGFVVFCSCYKKRR